MLNHRRRFWLCRFFAPASVAAAVVVCFVAPLPSGAQKIAPPKPKTKTTRKKDQELEKAIGKVDADLFNGVMNQFGDGETVLHLVTETTAEIKQDGFTGSISGRTVMRGNYGGAFVSEHELTFRQGEQSATVKTQFVCDGKTLWTVKPDAKQYTEQSLESAKLTLSKLIMNSSFDIVALIGTSSDGDDKPSNTKMESAHCQTDLWKGVPCRVLTIAYSENDKAGTQGTMIVYVANKRLKGLKMVARSSETPFTITETIKVMEPLPTPTDKTIFTFTPPAGVTKVDKFAD